MEVLLAGKAGYSDSLPTGLLETFFFPLSVTVFSVVWLVGWLVDWLVGWSVGWLVDWLVGRLVRLIVCLSEAKPTEQISKT